VNGHKVDSKANIGEPFFPVTRTPYVF